MHRVVQNNSEGNQPWISNSINILTFHRYIYLCPGAPTQQQLYLSLASFFVDVCLFVGVICVGIRKEELVVGEVKVCV